MIYGKLPIILLSAMASEADGSKEYQIAYYILSNRREAASLSIVALAERCHVSVSSISRFCRSLGLADFAELRAHEPHRIRIERRFERCTCRIAFKDIACKLAAERLGNLAAACVVHADKGNPGLHQRPRSRLRMVQISSGLSTFP